MDTATNSRLAHSIEESTEITGLGRTTLFHLIATNQLRSVKIGGRRLIPHSALVDLIEGAADAA